MKAAVIQHYGNASKLIIVEIPKPQIKDEEVLINIKACSVNPIDWKLRSGALRYFYRLRFPAILGFDLAGRVEAIGKNVRSLRVGDSVYTCSYKKGGQAYAQWIALEERSLSLKPKTMNFKEAASVPLAAMTALQALRDKGHIQEKQRLLIIGASGGVGMFAVQLAKIFGAHVSAVCSSANIEFVKSLGADKVINYDNLSPFCEEKNYDIIFDCVAAVHSSQAKNKLKPRGIYIATLPSLPILIQSISSLFTGKKVKIIMLKRNKKDLDYITQLIEDNKLRTHIDSEFNLEDIALAHLRSESQRTVGKIIVSLEEKQHYLYI